MNTERVRDQDSNHGPLDEDGKIQEVLKNKKKDSKIQEGW